MKNRPNLMKTHTVKEGGKLLEYVRKNFPELTNTKSKHLLQSGQIVVNDEIVTHHARVLKPGDKIRFQREPARTRIYDPGLPILYEDESLIAIDKPAGLLTVATERVKYETVFGKLSRYVESKDPKGRARVYIVHRLDRDASGILIFAKTQKAHDDLEENWKKFEKKYYAVVEGTPKKSEGTIKSFLVEDKFRRVYSARESKESKLSITHYKVLESWGNYSLLEIKLETGRKNQIRVHLKDLGHPIAGDEKYHAKTDPLKRLCLHSYYFSFTHPVTGERKTLTIQNPFLKKIFL